MSEPTGNGRYVSNAVLDAKMDKLRWEVRALILAAFVAGQVLPTANIAQTAKAALAVVIGG